jgi:hypothetical protein
MSKSTLHRWMPAIEAIAAEAELSQMGQQAEENPPNSASAESDLSQMGQAGADE